MFVRKKVDINISSDSRAKKNHYINEVIEVFGKYQIIQYILICLGMVFIKMMDINYVFVAGDINYR